MTAPPGLPAPTAARATTLTPSRFFGVLRLQEAGLLLVILLLGLALTLFSAPLHLPDGRTLNGFLRVDNLIGNVATPMSWMAIMAVGATFVIIAGGIDISVGSIFGLAALGSAAALQRLPEQAGPWVVLPVALLVPALIGLACGFVNGAMVVGLRLHPFIVTLATLSIFRGIGLVSVPGKALPDAGRYLPNAFTRDFMGWTLVLHRGGAVILLQPVPMVIMLLCVGVAWVYLSHCVGGRQIYAVGGNAEAARFSGLPVGRVRMRVYLVSGLAAGIAGMVATGFFGAANTATGEGYELWVVAAAAVGGASMNGGRGTALGALLGALVIQLIENSLFVVKTISLGPVALHLSRDHEKIIVGLAILLAVAIDQFSTAMRDRRMTRRG